jgi:hypothetical protein
MASTKVSAPAAIGPDRRWEVEDAVRTLTRAETIKRDPKLMKEVRVLAADVKRVAGREPQKPVKAGKAKK